MAVGFGVDSGLWVLMAQNGDKPQRVSDLASSLGIEPKLLSMCHLNQCYGPR